MELQVAGRSPLDKLVEFYDFKDINRAVDDSDKGTAIKPVLRTRSAAAPPPPAEDSRR
ncbi:MAG: hypothetical protein K2X87_28435 [Gemmataceae bacterium]|nr:hypothetical protein [Gemmataceae bacterium]